LLTALAFRRAPKPLAIALENGTRREAGARLELAPLTAEDAQTLIDPLHDAAARAAIYRESGGNPFYLEQLSRVAHSAARSAPAGRPQLGTMSVLPSAVIAAIDEELDGLSRECRVVLEAAAVAGESFEPQLVGAIAERNQREILGALDQLLTADLIRPTIAPQRFRFRHPIVRRAVYDRTVEGRRLGAHGRAATALAKAGAPLAVRAHHLERSALMGDEHAIAELMEAGRAATARAPLTAGHWLTAASALLPPDADPQRHAQLLGEAATAFTSAGAYEESLASLEEALSLVSDDQGRARADLIAKLAYARRRSGRPFESRPLLEKAIASLPTNDQAALNLRIELAFDHLWHDEFASARQVAKEMANVAQEHTDPAVTCIAAALLTMADSSEHRIADARMNLSHARDAYTALDDDQLAQRIYVAYYVGVAALRLEEADDALAYAQRGIDIAHATGQEATVTHWPAITTHGLVMKGRVSEATRAAETAVDGALSSGDDWPTLHALEADALAAYWAGNTNRALSSAHEMLTRSERMHAFLSGRARIQLAAALYAAGEPAHAVTELSALASPPGSWLLDLHAAFGWDILTRSYLALGDLEAARDAVRRASASTGPGGLPQQIATVRCAYAAVLLACEDPRNAVVAGREAVAIAAPAGNPLLTARAQAYTGMALHAAGETQHGGAELDTAEKALSSCGAFREADIVAHQLRRLGRRVKRRPRNTPGQPLSELSPRESEVAAHVVAGKTNREIATVLFLSEKTVETHLAHVYAKLGVKSRASLATMIARRPDPSGPVDVTRNGPEQKRNP
jgi:DNA-binding CsgD family transcriptional regulator